MNALLIAELATSINGLLISVQKSLELLKDADVTDEALRARIAANISHMEMLRDDDK